MSVTDVPVSYVAVAEPAAASEIPEGLDDTAPLPTWVTERTNVWTNVAVTERAWSMVTEHVVDVPEHVPPDHPRNLQPDDFDAVRTTDVPVS